MGDPEVGKSIMLMSIAAALSSGKALPGQAALPPMDVLLLNSEDAADDIIRGRIEVAGGNTDRVHVLNVNGPGQIQIPDDIKEVEKYVERNAIRFIGLDPLSATLPMKIDEHKNQHVRAALTPLWQMAKRRRAASAAVVHMNKKTGDNLAAMYRIAGSIGLSAAARSTMFVVRANPSDLDGPRQVVQDKASHARHGAVPTLQFKVASVPDPDFEGDTIAKVEWLENAAVAVDASSALQRTRTKPRDEAAAWLEGRLSGKGKVPQTQLAAEAQKLGIATATLRRAAKELGVRPQRDGKQNLWTWELDSFEEAPECDVLT